MAGESTSEITIDQDLTSIIEQYNADAIINLQIYVDNYDPGNTYVTGFLRIFGGASLILGVPILIWGLAEGDDEFLIPFGAVFSTAGGVCLATSFLLPSASKSIWTIGFDGDAVKRK